MKRKLHKLLVQAGQLAIYETGWNNIEVMRDALVRVSGKDNIETGKRAGRRFMAEMKHIEKNYDKIKKDIEIEIRLLSKNDILEMDKFYIDTITEINYINP